MRGRAETAPVENSTVDDNREKPAPAGAGARPSHDRGRTRHRPKAGPHSEPGAGLNPQEKPRPGTHHDGFVAQLVARRFGRAEVPGSKPGGCTYWGERPVHRPTTATGDVVDRRPEGRKRSGAARTGGAHPGPNVRPDWSRRS